jgi:D-beta-D-heptose 7-phosphate kinase/D-beta-D-heptose 1-phosphate adenosyltransferase
MKQSKHNIAVIGDACIDKFVYCECKRLCPEAPVPVLDVVRVTENQGMAGNVVENVKALNGSCHTTVNENCNKITKTRYVDDKTNHIFIRIDHAEKIEPIQEDLIEAILELESSFDAIIISDYRKGFLTEESISKLAKAKCPTFLDTKKKLGLWAKDIDFININKGEFEASEYEINLYNLYPKIIQTLGPDGAEYQGTNYPVKEVEVKDLSGAGDTFLAGLVVEYLNTKDIHKAILYANKCASKVVSRKGVSYVKPEDIE